MDELLARFLAWAESRPDIRAIILVGSRARADTPADEWSDVDLAIAATDPRQYLSNSDWLAEIGPWEIAFLEGNAVGGEVERRVLFADGRDADLVFFPAERLDELTARGPVAEVVRRGARVLLDRDDRLPDILARLPTPEPPRPPTAGEFANTVSDFWYHALWAARKLRRGELWIAKECCDVAMKRIVLRTLEWHARARGSPVTDTWFGGRFLERWADPRALGDLREAFAHYDDNDVRRALLATMRLFRWLGAETAERLELSYPTDVDEHATRRVAALLPDERGSPE